MPIASRMGGVGLALGLCAAAGCIRPAEERALADLEVGIGEIAGLSITVDDGAAQVREIEPGRIQLWSQAPVISALLVAGARAEDITTIEVENCMPGSVASASAEEGPQVVRTLETQRPTVCRFELSLPRGQDVMLRLSPPDADLREPYRIAVMGDIQTALEEVDEVFARINQIPDLRFVASTGDLVEDGQLYEYELFLEQVENLSIPYYSTIGNHELHGEQETWIELMGRRNLHFRFKGAAFSLVDSGSASLDPIVYDWLDGWLEEAHDDVHLFGTHYPATDPVGGRGGAFRSRKEAAKLLAKLAGGAVDATFYGHLHSYYAYDNAGIPAYISGGGGALPERFDEIGRHFLVVEIDPDSGLGPVGVVRVDD